MIALNSNNDNFLSQVCTDKIMHTSVELGNINVNTLSSELSVTFSHTAHPSVVTYFLMNPMSYHVSYLSLFMFKLFKGVLPLNKLFGH